MNVLALEFSSPGVSVALFQDGQLLEEVAWQEQRVASQPLFEKVPALLKVYHLSFAELDCIAVGRGPGNYTGLRVSLAAAQALVLPQGGNIFALSSGEALAQAAGQQTDAARLAVVGDARRQSCWYGLFERTDQRMEMQAPWRLCPTAELASRLPAAAAVVSPEYSRLTVQPDFDPEDTLQWLPGNRFPTAEFVGRGAIDRMERGLDSDPPCPLYMHPAVAVKS